MRSSMTAYAQVMFVVKTHRRQDLRLLEHMMQKHPQTYVSYYPNLEESGSYRAMYEGIYKDQLYVKIDDDIVFIKV